MYSFNWIICDIEMPPIDKAVFAWGPSWDMPTKVK